MSEEMQEQIRPTKSVAKAVQAKSVATEESTATEVATEPEVAPSPPASRSLHAEIAAASAAAARAGDFQAHAALNMLEVEFAQIRMKLAHMPAMTSAEATAIVDMLKLLI